MKVQFDIKCTVNIDLDNKDYDYYNQFKNDINKMSMSGEQLKEELLDDYINCCEMTVRGELNRGGYFDNIQVNSINIVK